MKLKIFRSFLVAVAIIGSAWGLSSCKDTDQDMNNQLVNENATLSQKLDSEVALLEDKIEALEKANEDLQKQMAKAKEECEQAWNLAIEKLRQDIENKNYVTETELNTRLEEYLTVTKFNEFKAEYDILAGTVSTLSTTVANIKTVLGENANGEYDTVADRFTAIESAVSALQTALGSVSQDLSDLQTSVGDMAIEINNINTSITNINTEISNIKTLVTNAQLTADKALTLAQKNEGRLDSMKSLIDGLKTTLNNAISTLMAEDARLEEKIVENKTNITKNANDIANLKTALENARTEAANNLAAAKQELTTMISNLGDALNTRIDELQTKVEELDNKLTDLTASVEANETAIEGINDQLNDMAGRIDNLENRVSSVVIQQVSNPVIGSLSLPFDMQSMILFNYWGVTSTPVKFPDFSETIGTNFGGDNALTDLTFLGVDYKYLTIDAGTDFIKEGDGNFGKVYFTVNPSNINMEGKEFTLVNSLDEEIPVKLNNVQPSDKLLSFGASRAATSSNGFYEADATVESATQIQPLRYELESGLKSALKDAVKERTLSSVKEVVYLLYKQFEKGVPAYGMKIAWDENGEAQSVHSNYGISALTFRPLSYALLDGTDLSGHLPNFPSLDALVDRLHFDFGTPTISFGWEDIKFDKPTVNMRISVNTEFTIELENITARATVQIPEQTVTKDGVEVGKIDAQEVYGSATVDLTQMKVDLNKQLHEKFESIFSELNGSINIQMQGVVDDIINNINSKVNEKLKKIFTDAETKVNESLEDVIKKLQNEVNGKVESVANRIEGYYNKIGSVYNRFKDVMSNPNHYLQVTMLCSSNGDLRRLSTSKAVPTILTGSGTAMTLIPTTYTFDILTPAYKKYVAVSNVYGPDGKDCSNDATCRSIRDAANNAQYMNTVLNGERLTVAFDFSAAANHGGGYTYELYYQALDYHGYTSTQKFYVKK